MYKKLPFVYWTLVSNITLVIMSKKLLDPVNILSIEIHCISAPFAVRCGHVLLSWLWRTPQIIGARKIFFICPFFPSGLWYFDVPFRFKGHSKLSAISSSLCSSLSFCLFCPSLPTIASVYFKRTLKPVYAFTWVYTCFVLPFVFNHFFIIYLPLILYIACSAFWLPSNRFNVLSDEMQ